MDRPPVGAADFAEPREDQNFSGPNDGGGTRRIDAA